MNIQRIGTIIYTENVDELVTFYKDVFDLKELFTMPNSLVCLEMGSGYLMIEKPEEKHPNPPISSRVKLRFNLEDVESFAKKLSSMNVKHTYQKLDWGEVVDFQDLDGNYISVRDEKGFIEQLK